MGAATLKENLLQKVADMREAVLHYIFLDLHKSYDALDRYCCLDILSGYSVGTRMIRILRTYWARIQMVAKVGVRYSPAFQSHSGVT